MSITRLHIQAEWKALQKRAEHADLLAEELADANHTIRLLGKVLRRAFAELEEIAQERAA